MNPENIEWRLYLAYQYKTHKMYAQAKNQLTLAQQL